MLASLAGWEVPPKVALLGALGSVLGRGVVSFTLAFGALRARVPRC